MVWRAALVAGERDLALILGAQFPSAGRAVLAAGIIFRAAQRTGLESAAGITAPVVMPGSAEVSATPSPFLTALEQVLE